ncbi:MAG: hypothetical protein ACLFUH_03985 [Bacteroidales bacterium]
MSGDKLITATGLFLLLMGFASNIGEIESALLFDFRKSLAEVGSPTVKIAEIALTLIGIGILFWGVNAYVE